MNNQLGYKLKDLWTGRDLGLVLPDEKINSKVAPTGVVFLKATIADF